MMKLLLGSAALLLPFGVSARALPLSARDTALTCDNNLSNGTVYQAAVGKYDILCGVDYAGGDMGSASVNTFEECIAACDNASGCVDVSYVNGACYMKSSLGSPSANSAVWTAKSTGSSSGVIPAVIGLTCDNPLTDGTLYKSVTGVEFQIYCATDFYGGDMFSQGTASFNACIDLCATNAGCVDVSYVSGTCYLKSTLTDAVSRSWVWSAKLPSVAIPGQQSSSSSSAAAASSTQAASSSVASTTAVVVSTTASTSSSAQAATSAQTTSAAAASSSTVSTVAQVSSSVATSAAASSTVSPTTTSKSTTALTTSAAASSTVSPTTTSKTSALTTSAAASSITTTSKAASSTTLSTIVTSVAVSTTASASKTTSAAASSTSSASGSAFTVLSAFYADKDITALAAKHWVIGNTMVINTIAPELQFGIANPWYLTIKPITVLYSLNGKQQVFTAYQNTGVYVLNTWSQFGAEDVPSIAAPSSSAIKIVSVVWGDDQITSSSVYQKLYASYATNSKVSFSDSTFGSASWLNSNVGVIYYTKNGVLNSLVAREGVSKSWF